MLASDSTYKCRAVQQLYHQMDEIDFSVSHTPVSPDIQPGYPGAVQLVAPKQLHKRGIQSQTGRNILLHALAHIEYNAIHLALDAVCRFPQQPEEFYRDWLRVAYDEARHFLLLETYLHNNGCAYGKYPAHNNLWEMARKTAHDVTARMALVPRVLEARGLDVSPRIIERLERVQDSAAVDILRLILQEEVAHVGIGSKWFYHHCRLQGKDPKSTFIQYVEQYLEGELRGPFNLEARLMAGFDAQELQMLNERYG